MKFLAARLLLFIAIILVSGCIQSNNPQEKPQDIKVKISSPKAGQIFTASKTIDFEAFASGGKEPYNYVWTSNINGEIGKGNSLHLQASRLADGEHTCIVKVTDSTGKNAEVMVIIHVM